LYDEEDLFGVSRVMDVVRSVIIALETYIGMYI